MSNSAAYAAMLAMITPDDPAAVKKADRLNQTDRCIYAYLVWRANGDRVCWKGVDEIMADLNIGTRQTACASLRKLKGKGLIGSKRSLRQVNHYAILDPDGRLYGETDWQPPWPLDVKKSAHQAPDVKKTAHQESRPDVKKSAQPDVKKTAQESLSTEYNRKSRSLREREPAVSPPLADDPPGLDLRKQVFTEGCAIIQRCTGRMNGQARGLVGRFLKDAHGDAQIVLDVLHVADADPPGEFVSWVVAAIKQRQSRRGQSVYDTIRAKLGVKSLLVDDDEPPFRPFEQLEGDAP